MKKSILFSLALIVLTSCSKEVLNETTVANPDYVFECNLQDTKIALGQKEGSVYKAVWENGDSLIVIKASDDSKIGVVRLTAGAGTSTGSFGLSSGELTEGTDVYLVYGSTDVPAVQKQAAGSKTLLTTAKSASIKVVKGTPMTFSLEHKGAIVKMVVSSTDFADLKLESVMLYSKGSVLAEKGSDNVEVIFSEPATLSSAQEVVFTACPVATATDFYAVVTMKGDGKTVTIPVKFAGKTLADGKVNTIKLENLTLASNSCADWYEPVDTRDFLGGWAYGAANTFFVCTNATDTEYNFFVKARGRFNKVSKPVYCGFVMFKDRNYNSFLKLGPNGYQGIDPYDATTETFSPKETNTLNSDCSFKLISLCNTPYTIGTTFSVVGIYNADKELIWSFMIQRYGDSDPIRDIEYKDLGVTLLDRALGQSLGSTVLSDPSKNNGDLMSYSAYFQWGRKDPFPYVYENATAPGKYKKAQPLDKQDASSTIENAIKHPNIAYLLSKTQNWMPDMPVNLWGVDKATSGVADNSAIGHKTIYDPCPEGYRVCDSRVLDAVIKNAAQWERTNVINNYHPGGAEEEFRHDTYFGGSCLAYPLGDGKVDYWLYSGYIAGNTFNPGRTNTGSDSGGLFWSNNFVSSGKPAAFQYLHCPKMVKGGYATGASYLCSVRCQKIM